MNKKWIFAGMVAAAMVVGSATTYFFAKASQLKQANELVSKEITQFSGAANHFTSNAEGGYPDLTFAAENAVYAVVNVEVTQKVNVSQTDPFLQLFGIPQGYSQGSEMQREVKAGGSGVIISSDGYIVTNHHVIDNATKLKVKLYDGRTLPAELIGTDPTTEVALIKVDATELPTLAFGNSDALRLGEWVLAIGSPFDLQSTITAGIVSAKSRNLRAIPNQYSVESFIQTDAAVNPGNSGGALVNTRGELMGINTLIKSQTGTYMGYSFAIPSAIVKKVVVDLKEYGVVQRALLGISYQEINDEFIERFGKEYGIDKTGGVYVASVSDDGAAKAAGVHEGDIITIIDGTQLGNNTNLSEIMSRYRPNDKINITVKRDGKVKQMDIVLRNKAGKAELLSKDYVDTIETLGGQFTEINSRIKKELKIEHGIRVAEVRGEGILAKARIKEGFIITHINERAINSINDLKKITDTIAIIDGIYPNGRAVTYSLIQ